ncbi:hypothetical protein AURDEDRAFT_117024 [Auricularia subglabra TFB-10046 SS5]|uniref:Uncharacterized protein n=1 Tax=Auricularia subglabra (strain TFB-10046 / SS5) TaxID=717982 RepID=J0WV15_AURST|nr:hypothetical protein AURDEDRAFT_117024 [Auricularia subglabra TFB-10046 SS5]
MYGKERMVGVMDSIINRFTGHKRSESYPFNRVDIGLAFRDDALEELDSPVAFSLRAAALNYALHGRATSFDAHSRALVGMGAAVYGRDVTVARIYEPLIILNLARWLLNSRSYSVTGRVFKQKMEKSSLPLSDTAFIEGLAACLRDLFGSASPASMQAALDFAGRPPTWAHGPARLVVPQLSHHRSPFAPYAHGTDVLAHTADTPDDVFRWLENASHPFLIPDPGFGPALLCVVELADRQRMLLSVDARVFREHTPASAALCLFVTRSSTKRTPTAARACLLPLRDSHLRLLVGGDLRPPRRPGTTSCSSCASRARTVPARRSTRRQRPSMPLTCSSNRGPSSLRCRMC